MTEFRKQYQNELVDFHLWSQDKIAEFWWKKALGWVNDNCDLYDRCGGWQGYIIEDELEE